MSESKVRSEGYKCPVQGCWGKKKRLFNSPVSTARHINDEHGCAELEKRLRVKTHRRVIRQDV